MDKEISKLKELISNCYGEGRMKSSAMLVAKGGKAYYGVSVYPNAKDAGMTSISNAICSAVSDGVQEFERLLVYAVSMDTSFFVEGIIDNETVRLINEFCIERISVVYSNGTLVEVTRRR